MDKNNDKICDSPIDPVTTNEIPMWVYIIAGVGALIVLLLIAVLVKR